MAGKMTIDKIFMTFVFLLIVRVSCWTVDLAEMNRLNLDMETTERSLESNDEENEKNYMEDGYDAANYGDLEYQSYMEKKIHGVLYNGSIYVDGLRKAMAEYRKKLENCTTLTTTTASSTWLPENDPSDQTDQDPCRHVMAASDQVTKMSELALWATNELRERKFADNKDTAQREEEELLLKLAWFLDQLAHLTGYNPDPNDFQSPTPTASTPTETTEDNISTASYPETTNPLEIMRSVENGPPLSKFAPKPSTFVKNVQKRSVDDEMTHFVKNYLKYKVWNSDNSENNVKSSDPFEVKNEINTKSIQKRAAFIKKAVRHRPSTEKQERKYKTKKIFIKKPINYFQKHNNVMAVKVVRKLIPSKYIQKRSAYYADYGLSRVPENPMQDLSYYVKNKPGTNYDYSPVQVANVNESLVKHYDVGNIETIRRFGSNVTLGTDNLLLGSIKSMSDAQ